MRIRRKFLKLTKTTYPHGTEKFLEDHLPDGYKIDKFGNYYLSIGNSNTMFTCHLDTACREYVPITHTFFGEYIMTDGTTILGADDKAGVIVSMYMIENKIPGLYYFFIGEEVGCVGSSALSREIEMKGEYPKELDNIEKVISFDRRGTTSVITSQFYGTCCSDEFANALCKELNDTNCGLYMRPDNTGILTDSAQFMGIMSECTNISVGYYDEHTFMEKQDINHLYNLCNAVIKVDWESLPSKRKPNKDYYYDWDEWETPVSKSKKSTGDFSEDIYTYVKNEDGTRKKAYISNTWINHEILLISNMFKKQGRNIEEITWDGSVLWAKEHGCDFNEFIGNRKELSEFIEKFMQIPITHLKYSL